MKPKEWYKSRLEKFRADPEFIAEEKKIEFCEDMLKLMDKKGLSRSDLAARLGCSKAYITKLLNGRQNFTLKKLVEIALALDAELELRLEYREGKRSESAVGSKQEPLAYESGEVKKSFAAEDKNNHSTYRDAG